MDLNMDKGKKMRAPTLKAGAKFGKLTVIGFHHRGNHYRKFYSCRCDCGNEGVWQVNALTSGNTKSCGCAYRDMGDRNRLPDNQGAINHLILNYKRHARNRNIPFEITTEVFTDNIKQSCYYCGRPPSNLKVTKNLKVGFKYSGIDRVDSSLGYVAGNVVPCCKKCNIGKHDMGRQEFLDWVRMVYECSCI